MKTVKPEGLLQGPDQPVEIGGRDRIEARGRLVEKTISGSSASARASADALGHAAGQFGGKFVGVVRAEADHFELGHRHSFISLRQRREIRASETARSAHGQRREQRALLEQDAPARSDRANRSSLARSRSIPRIRCRAAWAEADDGAQQHRFAAARGADDAEDLAARTSSDRWSSTIRSPKPTTRSRTLDDRRSA
jgi:hypothetical protein